MKKFIFLLYGLGAYLVFLVTFCYAIGFVTTLVVPKHIDSDPQVPLGQALLINAALLGLFAIQHSVMARPAFKSWWTKTVPVQIERSTYVLLASICLILVFRYWEPMGGLVWQVQSETAQTALKAISLLGFFTVFVSTLLINHFDLFGLRQVWFYFTGKEYHHLAFRTPFFYKYVRHPLYLGFIIAFWAAPAMTVAHLFFAVMTTAYMLIAIQLEEHDLIQHFGSKYQEYKRAVPMLIPFTKGAKSKAAKPEQMAEEVRK